MKIVRLLEDAPVGSVLTVRPGYSWSVSRKLPNGRWEVIGDTSGPATGYSVANQTMATFLHDRIWSLS